MGEAIREFLAFAEKVGIDAQHRALLEGAKSAPHDPEQLGGDIKRLDLARTECFGSLAGLADAAAAEYPEGAAAVFDLQAEVFNALNSLQFGRRAEFNTAFQAVRAVEVTSRGGGGRATLHRLNDAEKAILAAMEELAADGVEWPTNAQLSERSGYPEQRVKEYTGGLWRHEILDKGPTGAGFSLAEGVTLGVTD